MGSFKFGCPKAITINVITSIALEYHTPNRKLMQVRMDTNYRPKLPIMKANSVTNYYKYAQ